MVGYHEPTPVTIHNRLKVNKIARAMPRYFGMGEASTQPTTPIMENPGRYAHGHDTKKKSLDSSRLGVSRGEIALRWWTPGSAPLIRERKFD